MVFVTGGRRERRRGPRYGLPPGGNRLRREEVQVSMKAPLGLLLAVVLLGGCAAKDAAQEGAQAPASASAPAPGSTPAPSAAQSPGAGISLPGKLPKTTKAEPPVDD